MKHKGLLGAILLVIVALSGMGIWAQSGQLVLPVNSLETLFGALEAQNTAATVEFTAPIARLGASVRIGTDGETQVQRVGADMVCFGVAGQSLTQVTCVPYTQIRAVLYSE